MKPLLIIGLIDEIGNAGYQGCAVNTGLGGNRDFGVVVPDAWGAEVSLPRILGHSDIKATRVYAELDPEPVAVGAHPVGIVKAEQSGGELEKKEFTMGADSVLAEQNLLPTLQYDGKIAVANFETGFNGVEKAVIKLNLPVAGDDPIPNDPLDSVRLRLFQRDIFGPQIEHRAINANLGEAIAKRSFEDSRVGSLTTAHDRR